MFSALGPGTTCTSSQPSSPHVSRICLVAWVSNGMVAYSQVVVWLMTEAYRSARPGTGPLRDWIASLGGDQTE